MLSLILTRRSRYIILNSKSILKILQFNTIHFFPNFFNRLIPIQTLNFFFNIWINFRKLKDSNFIFFYTLDRFIIYYHHKCIKNILHFWTWRNLNKWCCCHSVRLVSIFPWIFVIKCRQIFKLKGVFLSWGKGCWLFSLITYKNNERTIIIFIQLAYNS